MVGATETSNGSELIDKSTVPSTPEILDTIHDSDDHKITIPETPDPSNDNEEEEASPTHERSRDGCM